MNVSIIIPVYNAERYLSCCLKSALKQTVKEKEIICIDDGSTDSSRTILRGFCDRYNEIKVYHQENQGSGVARNKGIEMAKGRYVAFLDADDFYCDTHALEQMLQVANQKKAMICGSFRKLLNLNGTIENMDLHRDLFENNNDPMQLDYYEYQDDFHYQSYIFNRKLILRNNIRFPRYRRYQDPPFFVQSMLSAGDNIWIVPVELYVYRLGHQDLSVNRKYITQFLSGMFDTMRLAKKYGLRALQDKIVSRINNDFRDTIMAGFNRDVLMILSEIENQIISDDLHLSLFHFYDIDTSNNIMKGFIESKFKYMGIEDYLLQHGVHKISIYGLGYYGHVVYNMLKDSGLQMVIGIDQSVDSFYDLPVSHNIEDCNEGDLVIVTPIRETNEIINVIREITDKPVIGLMELMKNVERYKR